ncbi:MAG: RagB/SusD family nutrient uptake outer membrane protein [Bacteroidales bacterium]|nr:RagB/SusD family nutrient uptake outer membrane protein [Bacteroidales bacterium]
MQKFYITICVFLLLACEGVLHENEDKYDTLDNEEEKIALLEGIYSNFKQIYGQNYFQILTNSDDINYIEELELPGCSLSKNGYYKGYDELINNNFQKLYSGIITANKLIQQCSSPKDNYLLGEVYLLRAYSYYVLVRLYINLPLVTDIDVNFNLKKSSTKELYAFIESDYMKALELLPENMADLRYPHQSPTKSSVKALLAEMYLSMAGYPLYDTEKYELAAQYSGEVIESAQVYNYSLVEDINDLWKENSPQYSESLFSLFFRTETDGNNTNLIGMIDSDFEYGITTSGIGESMITTSLYYKSQYISDFRFFADFPHNYRKYNTMKCGAYLYYDYDDKNQTNNYLEFIPYDPYNNPCKYAMNGGYLKWADKTILDTINKDSFFRKGIDVPVYLLRYTQTLLTYAESKARIGEPDDIAYNIMNKIRRRANGLPLDQESDFDLSEGLNSQQFIDSVLYERKWELCMEPNGRWFDIIRLDILEEIQNNAMYPYAITTIPDSYYSDDGYFFKIPEHDKWINPNLSDTTKTN